MRNHRPRWVPDDCTCGWSPPVYPVRDWECDDPDDNCPHHGETQAPEQRNEAAS